MQDKELSYVQASRARGVTQLFTTQMEAGPEHERLSRMMSKSHQKQLATDLQEQQGRHENEVRAQQERQRQGNQEIRLIF
jgi:hypothetical protein